MAHHIAVGDQTGRDVNVVPSRGQLGFPNMRKVNPAGAVVVLISDDGQPLSTVPCLTGRERARCDRPLDEVRSVSALVSRAAGGRKFLEHDPHDGEGDVG